MSTNQTQQERELVFFATQQAPSNTQYQATINGQVTPGENAEVSGAGSNDFTRNNPDGTVTFGGETGPGFSDNWIINGEIETIRLQAGPEVWELSLDGEVMTPQEIKEATSSGGQAQEPPLTKEQAAAVFIGGAGILAALSQTSDNNNNR